MPRDAYFCYERNHHGKWCPVIHYDERPTTNGNDNTKSPQGLGPIRSTPILIDKSLIIEGEVIASFVFLEKLYPPPDNLGLKKETFAVKKEPIMAREVTGFMSAHGKFFDTEDEADFYDHSFELNRLLREAITTKFGPELPTDAVEELISSFVGFINTNDGLINDYINVRKRISAATEPDEVVRPATGANPSDDEGIRTGNDSSMDETFSTETKPSRPRKSNN